MNWNIGRLGSVVSTEPYEGIPASWRAPEHVASYGGYLVAESIPTRKLANLIAAAPKMLEALENIENDDNRMPDTAWALIQDAIREAKEGK